MAHLDVLMGTWVEGVPGIDDSIIEWFAVRFRDSIQIDQAGEYQFCLNSDDGSRLSCTAAWWSRRRHPQHAHGVQ